MRRIDLFTDHLREKRAVKVIAGIDNFDVENIRKVISAATQAGASAIDISARRDIIEMAREMTDLPLFVSSIEPEELAMAVEMGADAIELGNFDALYRNGMKSMTSEQVLDLVRRTLSLIRKEDVFFSVTIPGELEIAEQIELARSLEELRIDLIQTEGYFSTDRQADGVRGLLQRAELTIANTLELSRNVEIPIMTASGINSTTAPFAFAAGASAIGVGSCINKLDSSISMLAVSKNLVEIASRNAERSFSLV